MSADFDINPFLDLLQLDGTYCLVGLPPNGVQVKPFNIATNRRSLTGSMIGGSVQHQQLKPLSISLSVPSLSSASTALPVRIHSLGQFYFCFVPFSR